MESAYKIITSVNNHFHAELANKILSDENLFKEENLVFCADRLISPVDTPEKLQIANRILSDERLYTNFRLVRKAEQIIGNVNSDEQLQAINIITDKILDNEHFSDILEYAGDIIENTTDMNIANVKCKLIDKFLSDVEKLKIIIENE